MRRRSMVVILSLFGCELAGCGNEQPPAPPVVAGTLPQDPMSGSTVPKKPSKNAGKGNLPSMPAMPGGGSSK
jgi:hypothetical protein